MEVVDGLFVDTSAWYALVSPDDRYHQEAARLYERLEQQGAPLTTTDWVLSEAVAVLEGRVGRPVALRAGDRILASRFVRVECLTREQVERAWGRYAADVSRPSLVDCSSFVVMEDLGLTRAFAFDEDFVRAGFRVEV